MNWGQVLMEALICGIAVLVFGLIINWLHKSMSSSHTGYGTGTRNLGWLLFFTGIVVYFVMELSGANSWYCKNGNACLAY